MQQRSNFGLYLHNGRTYRKLSESERARMDATRMVEVRSGKLYYDGRRVKINTLWVAKVYAAYHWNGGVVVVADTSMRWRGFPDSRMGGLGFIDLKADRCKFTPIGADALRLYLPDFLTPVTVNMSSALFSLDVAMPEKVFVGEMLDVAASLTNVSAAAMAVPDSLADGMGMVWRTEIHKPSGEKATVGTSWRNPGYSVDPENPSSPLEPRQTRQSTLPFDVRKMFYMLSHGTYHAKEKFYVPGSYRMLFYWDCLLDPGARDAMGRFTCERRVEVAEPAIDTSSGDLLLEVTIPESVPMDGRLDIVFSLTNNSGGTILVPDSLCDGLGVALDAEKVMLPSGSLFASRSKREMRKLVSYGNEVVRHTEHKKHPVLRIPYRGYCSPLGPGERREGRASLGARSVFPWPGRHRVLVHWDGMLDPDARGSVSRFEADGVWVEVAKAGPAGARPAAAAFLMEEAATGCDPEKPKLP
jgi:hypothetical protein